MILHGNPRGGAKDLALHLLKSENEHVEVHQLRGFISDDLKGALNEAYAVSRGTKAKQFLFSLSLNPPPQEKVSTEDFENAITRIEKELGLNDQPLAVVFHEKEGRRHCHAIWSRTDTQSMTVKPLPFYKRKLRDISKALYLEHGWDMPRGFIDKNERDYNNFTHAQWQQAKRKNQDPRKIKSALQDCWALSDTQSAFKQALKERGFTLARGDKRGFVVLDNSCEIRSVSKKWINVKAADVRKKLSAPESLPSVDEAKAQIARDMMTRLSSLRDQHREAAEGRKELIEQKRRELVKRQVAERESLNREQEKRWQLEARQRQDRFNKGIRGLLDHFTGQRRQIKERNERDALLAYQRDQKERDTLIFRHIEQRRTLHSRAKLLDTFKEKRQQTLSSDIQQYKEIQAGKREIVDFKDRMQKRATADFKQRMQSRSRVRGPERER